MCLRSPRCYRADPTDCGSDVLRRMLPGSALLSTDVRCLLGLEGGLGLGLGLPLSQHLCRVQKVQKSSHARGPDCDEIWCMS